VPAVTSTCSTSGTWLTDVPAQLADTLGDDKVLRIAPDRTRGRTPISAAAPQLSEIGQLFSGLGQ
jgi:hypothetical protein